MPKGKTMYNVQLNLSLHSVASLFDDMGREYNFSLYGIEAIMQYLEEVNEGEAIKLDVIELCCMFSEESPEEVVKSQGWYVGEAEEACDVVRKLNYSTWAVELGNGNILYMNN